MLTRQEEEDLKQAIAGMVVGMDCHKRLSESTPELSWEDDCPPKGYGYRVLLLSTNKDSLVLLKDGKQDCQIPLRSIRIV